jgi:hypothetical protein
VHESVITYLSLKYVYLFFQRCLQDAVQDNEMITILHWASEYELKPDKINLTEASAKLYLEQLLTYTRRVMDRKRTFSSTSSGSASSATSSHLQATSTPDKSRQKVLASSSITRDMA